MARKLMKTRIKKASGNATSTCNNCGARCDSLQMHWRREHQRTSTIHFPSCSVSVNRDDDGYFHCPSCNAPFQMAQNLQIHAKSGRCIPAPISPTPDMTPGSQAISSVHPAVRLRIPSRSERVKDGIQFIGVRNPAHPDDQEMIEVDYKLEERSQGDGSEDMAQEHFHESPNASDTQPQPVQIARAEGISETLPSRQTDIDTRQTSHPSLTESRPGAHLSFPSTSYRASTTFSGRFQTPEWDYTTYRSTESQTQNSNAPSAGTPDADITRLSIQPHVDTDDRSRDGPNDPDVVGADSRPSPMPRHSTVHRDSTSHSDDMTLIRTTDVQRIPSQDHPSRIAPEQSTSSLGGSSRSPAISTPAARSPGTSGVSNTLSPSFKAESERDIIEIRSEPPPTVSDLSDEVLTFLNGVSEDSQSFIHAFSGLGFRTGRHLDALCRRPESQRAEFRKILWDEHGIKYGDITLLEDELDRRRENLRSGT